MNNKKAKQLKRQAEQATIGMPNAKYMPYAAPNFFRDSSTGRKVKTKGVPLLLAHACTRNIYKLLKGQGKINLTVIRGN